MLYTIKYENYCNCKYDYVDNITERVREKESETKKVERILHKQIECVRLLACNTSRHLAWQMHVLISKSKK